MGRFISIEGLDGTGKNTQTGLLVDWLIERGYRVKRLDFPDYGSEGSSLVRYYLGGGLGDDPNAVSAYAASSFFACDRYISYIKDWKSDTDDPDTVVIANRYTTANAYHQLSKLPRDEWDGFLSWLYDYEFSRLGLPKPDGVLLLAAPLEVSLAHVMSRSLETGVKRDIHEADREYLRRSHEAAHYAAEKLGWTVIPCCPDGENELYPREVIAEKISANVKKILSL